MILEYEKKQSIYAEDIEYVEDEEVLTANIIKTDYIPTNFVLQKTFVLEMVIANGMKNITTLKKKYIMNG